MHPLETAAVRFPFFVSLLVGSLGLLSGCPESHGTRGDAGPGADVGTGGDAGGCAGSSALFCVSACGSDAGYAPTCTDGAWVCPPGTRDAATCPPGCVGRPPPGCACRGTEWVCESPVCPEGLNPWDPTDPLGVCSVEGATCSNGSTDACGAGMFCTCTSGRWNCAVAEPDPVCWCGRQPTEGDRCAEDGASCGECCPTPGGTGWPLMFCDAGHWRAGDCPAIECPPLPAPACPVEAATLIGTACSSPGATCGSECCGSAVVCEAGVWRSEPGVPCLRCDEYPCGSGACTEAQLCHLGCGPADGPEYTCEPMPPGCTSCDCLPPSSIRVCEMIDGHPHVRDLGFCG